MNFYSEANFCEAFRAAYFPGSELSPVLFKANNLTWKIPAINHNQAIVKFPFQSSFIDFYEPYPLDTVDSDKSTTQFQKLSYIPRACQGFVSAEDWFQENMEDFYDPAPTILWKEFQDWDGFVAYVRQKRSGIFSDSRRRQRKLERKFGPLEFQFNDTRLETLETCIRWKSEQYRRTGELDSFAYQEHIQFFKELQKQNCLIVSSINIQDQPIAIHLGVSLKGRFYYWIPAYDPSYSAYSPGRLILLKMIEKTFQEGYSEFDFLSGNEPYKWYYATHTRLISAVGKAPITTRSKKFLRSTLKPVFLFAFDSFPQLKSKVKAISLALNMQA